MSKTALIKILQSQGFGSRRECGAMIAAGRVRIGADVVLEPEKLFETQGLRFLLDGAEQLFRERLYVALHKGAGYECSSKPSHHPSVLELFPEQYIRRGLQPAGRLDWDTRGLLILSDDGPFIHTLASPRRHIPKTYRARTARPITEAFLEAVRSGVLLRDETDLVRALHCARLGEREVELSLGEGKYHQVKRMIAAAGNHCEALERTAVGGLRLEDLGLGENEWRLLETDECALLLEESGGAGLNGL